MNFTHEDCENFKSVVQPQVRYTANVISNSKHDDHSFVISIPR